jgi:hypothetical protein
MYDFELDSVIKLARRRKIKRQRNKEEWEVKQ